MSISAMEVANQATLLASSLSLLVLILSMIDTYSLINLVMEKTKKKKASQSF
jgi:hypothetical protein